MEEEQPTSLVSSLTTYNKVISDRNPDQAKKTKAFEEIQKFLRNIINKAELCTMFERGELVLMLVKDADTLRTILNSMDNDQQCYDLLMTHYKESDNDRNIDTPALVHMFSFINGISDENIVACIEVIFQSISSQKLREKLMSVSDSEGDNLAHKIITRVRSHDTIIGFIECLKTNIPRQIPDMLVKRNFLGKSSLKSLTFYFAQNECFTTLASILSTEGINKLNFLQSPVGDRQRSLAHEIVSGRLWGEEARNFLQQLEEHELIILLQTTDSNGNTLLHHMENIETIQHLLHRVPFEERLKALKAINNDGEIVLNSISGSLYSLKMLASLIGNNEDVMQDINIIEMQNSRGETLLHSKLATLEQKFLNCNKMHAHIDNCYQTRFSTKAWESAVAFIVNRPGNLGMERCLALRNDKGQTFLDETIKLGLKHKRQPPLVKLLNSIQAPQMLYSQQLPQQTTTAHLICQEVPQLMTPVIGTISSSEHIVKVLQVNDEKFETPVHKLAQHSCLEHLHGVTDKTTPDQLSKILKCQNQQGQTIIHTLASQKTSTGDISKILNGLPKSEALSVLKSEDKSGATAIHIAAAHRNRIALSEMAAAVGKDGALQILNGKDFEPGFDRNFYRADKTDQRVREMLMKFQSKASRSATEPLLSSLDAVKVHPKLRSLIKEKDDEDVESAKTEILKSDLREGMEKARFFTSFEKSFPIIRALHVLPTYMYMFDR